MPDFVGLGVAASIISVVDLGTKVLHLGFKYGRSVKNAHDTKARLLQEVSALCSNCAEAKRVLDGPHGAQLSTSRKLLSAITESESLFKQLQERLDTPKTVQPNIGEALTVALKWPLQNNEVQTLIQELRLCTNKVKDALQIDQTATILSVHHTVVLDRLPKAVGASFGSQADEHERKCLAGTRVEILAKIHTWAADSSAKSIFWLNGMAGTGKSTISRTVAQSFSESKNLIASFFFNRREADRASLTKFFTTLAAELAIREPATAPYIKEALNIDPAITSKTAREQFEKLFYNPLAKAASRRNGNPAVIVIDALDECERDNDIRLLVHLLSGVKDMTIPVRVFITSRPDLYPRLAFSCISGTYQDVNLEKMTELTIERDILTFIKHELANIRNDYNKVVTKERQLADNWPHPTDVNLLSKLAVPLFIFAFTACRTIANFKGGPVDKQLNDFLTFQAQTHGSRPHHTEQLRGTYMPVLNKLISDLPASQQKSVVQRFKDIVGPLVTLASPLPANALAQILEIDKSLVDSMLDLLYSVVIVPAETWMPVRLLHLSFRDFIVDAEACNRNFWIDEKHVHHTMVDKCLRIMDGLKQDICGIKDSTVRRSTVSSERISRALPSALQYACTYWSHHLGNASNPASHSERVFEFLKKHLLHWLEALSLIGKAMDSLDFVRNLHSTFKREGNTDLLRFLYDTERCLLVNLPTLDLVPLQVYSTFIMFAPMSSILRKNFEFVIAQTVLFPPNVQNTWGQCMQTLEGHDSGIKLVTLSPDSTLIASASDDGSIRLWLTLSGKCIHVLEGHADDVMDICFSADSTMVVSALKNKTIRVWSTISGECFHVLRGHNAKVNSVAVSPDSRYIASGSADHSIRLWDIKSGVCLNTFVGHVDDIASVAFSGDSSLIVSLSDDCTIRIWSTVSGKCVKTIQEARVSGIDIRFFNANELISRSDDGEIQIYQIDSGDCTTILPGSDYDVLFCAWSPDSRYIALGFGDDRVEVWSIEGGVCVHELHHSTDVVCCAAFSKDSTYLVSGSENHEVIISHLDSTEYSTPPEEERKSVDAINLSPDAKIVASASSSPLMISLWDAETGELLHNLYRRSSYMPKMAFSANSKLVAAVDQITERADKSPIQIWQVDTGDCIQTIKTDIYPLTPVSQVIFSQDTSRIVVTAGEGLVAAWSISSGQCLYFSGIPASTISLTSFSQDMQLLATSPLLDPLDKITVWHVESQQCMCSLRIDFLCDGVDFIEFSPDASLIAAAGNHSLLLWRVDTSECIYQGNLNSLFVPPSLEAGVSQALSNAGIAVRDGALGIASSLFKYGTSLCGWKYGYGISKNGSWVTWNGKEFLWLPPDVRPITFIVSGSTVIIHTQSETTVIMKFVFPRLGSVDQYHRFGPEGDSG